jgi:hypothetical protein
MTPAMRASFRNQTPTGLPQIRTASAYAARSYVLPSGERDVNGLTNEEWRAQIRWEIAARRFDRRLARR